MPFLTLNLAGEVQVAKAPRSSLHSKATGDSFALNVNLAFFFLVFARGPESIFVFGGLVSAESSSTIVTRPLPSLIEPPLTFESVTVNVSLPSAAMSPLIGTSIVVVEPAPPMFPDPLAWA